MIIENKDTKVDEKAKKLNSEVKAIAKRRRSTRLLYSQHSQDEFLDEEPVQYAALLPFKPPKKTSRCKNCCKKLSVASLTKKSTGGLFISGQGFYTSVHAINLSILMIILLLFILVTKSSEIGTIVSESIEDLDFFLF